MMIDTRTIKNSNRLMDDNLAEKQKYFAAECQVFLIARFLHLPFDGLDHRLQ